MTKINSNTQKSLRSSESFSPLIAMIIGGFVAVLHKEGVAGGWGYCWPVASGWRWQ